ncbi:cytochrome P450 hydroxylase [Rhizoctonia solani AG-1 IA]|uniref:Cytochrome P450 hydroxylase n=1 Tax=Thanatephorus cucumeris (strain AG1-IA) TaxID=983506 RepID=L8WX50_THACA|nr:cytochrome P450 hydroxylase [Rhizoctonia solani AG-1 IA]
MSTGSIAAVLGNIACFVLKYGTIWLALYFGRYLVTLWVSLQIYLFLWDHRRPLQELSSIPARPSHRWTFRRSTTMGLTEVSLSPQLTPKLHEEYEKLYGKTIKFQGMAYVSFDQRLMTVDPVSINYIALNPFAGADNQGIFTTEGEMHRKLRRVIAPAFSYQSVKNLTPLFFHKSFEYHRRFRAQVSRLSSSLESHLLACEWTCTIGLDEQRSTLSEWPVRACRIFTIPYRASTDSSLCSLGFGYEFHSIQEETNTFYDAYRCMFNALRQVENKLHNLGLFFPQWVANCLPDARTKEVKRCRKIIEVETRALFAKRREGIAAEKAAGATVGKDFVMLNLLLRSNEADSVYLTESEIIAQIDSIMFAGHDTTSMAIQWALWELTRYPPVQARLRAELAPLVPILKDFVPAGPSETGHKYADLTGELGDLAARLDALPYLEKFVREVLRFHPSVHSTFRVAMKDDIIPVSEPVRNQNGEISKAWVGDHKTGLSSGGIRIRKGEFIHIPIEGMHLLKSVWGEDAHDFNPDRWDSLPAKVKASPGLYSCPASRWALVEIKVMLAVMIASFEFTGASPMSAHNFLVGRPYERNKFEKGKIDSLGYERSC